MSNLVEENNNQILLSKTTLIRHWVGLGIVLVLSGFLNWFRIAQEGIGNQYYAAAIKSMAMNWHNFFFNAFDPAGFVSVDKPPLGLWVQTISTLIFGFEGWALMLPQALAGVLSVLVMFFLVKRTFGPAAGIIAAFVLSITPIFVAANRNNTMDSQLVLTSLLAAWAISIAVDPASTIKPGKRFSWLLVCSTLVGIGFNIKMLQAYLVLPAFFLLYLIVAPLPVWKRFVHTAAAFLLVLVFSLSWAVAVDLTPPENRPYVGSSRNNSVLELIIGHNGMLRLLPGGLRQILAPVNGNPPNPPGSQPYPLSPQYIPLIPGSDQSALPLDPSKAPFPQQYPSPDDYRPSTLSAFIQEVGEPGALRLFNRQLFGQASWLLPMTLIAVISIAWQEPGDRKLVIQRQSVLLWVLWLIPQIIFFSFANLFHRYYLCMMAPGIAGLVAGGLVTMWKDLPQPGWKGWLLPIGLVFTTGVQAVCLVHFSAWDVWMSPVILSLTAMAVFVLILLRMISHREKTRYTPLVLLGCISIFLAPLAWSLTPLLYGGDTALPYAGPELAARHRPPPGVYLNLKYQPLLRFLLENRGDETFMLATIHANDGSAYILATGEPVMAMGGFSGSDPILSVESLLQMIKAGEVRFFLFLGNTKSQEHLVRFVQGHCMLVTPGEAGLPQSSPPPSAGAGPAPTPPQFFDCYVLVEN